MIVIYLEKAVLREQPFYLILKISRCLKQSLLYTKFGVNFQIFIQSNLHPSVFLIKTSVILN